MNAIKRFVGALLLIAFAPIAFLTTSLVYFCDSFRIWHDKIFPWSDL